jgi:hypothetical protein
MCESAFNTSGERQGMCESARTGVRSRNREKRRPLLCPNVAVSTRLPLDRFFLKPVTGNNRRETPDVVKIGQKYRVLTFYCFRLTYRHKRRSVRVKWYLAVTSCIPCLSCLHGNPV